MPKSPYTPAIKHIKMHLPTLPGGLHARLMLLVLLSFVPSVALFSYVAWEERRYGAMAAEEEALRLVRLGAAQQQELLLQTRNLLTNAIEIFAAQGPERTARCQSLVSSLIRPFPYYVNMGVADTHGDIVCSATPMKQPVNITDRGYFREAMARTGFAISDFQIGRITGKPTLVVAHRLHDSARGPGGVVFVALDLSWLNKLLVTMDMPAGAAITVIDSKGTVFARHPDADGLVGKHFPDAPLLRAILDRPGEGKLSASGLDGVQQLCAHATLLDTGANRIYITLGIPEDIVYAPVRMMLIRNILILSVIALLVFAIAWWGSDVFVLRQARALTEAANRLRRGEPGARTRLPHDRTELGQLAQTFDIMAADLEQRQQETEQAGQQLRRVNRALATLSAGNRALVNATGETALLQDMCRIVVEHGGYRMAWVGLAEDGTARRIQPVAHAGYEDGYLATLDLSCADEERGQGPACTAIRAGQAQAVRDIATDVHFAPWRAEALKRGYVSCLALPLHFDESMDGRGTSPGRGRGRPRQEQAVEARRGVLVIYSDDPDAFGGQEFELLQETANDLSFGIVTLRDRIKQRQKDETIHRMAYTDTVTGLASRLQLEEQLHAMLRRSRSCRDRPLAVIMLRIERFREINNALGHPAGDALLRQVGERLRGAITGTELVARNGSRDFAVLLPDTDAGHALQRAHELRALLNTPFTLGDLTLDAQASAGVALCPGHGTEPELLIRHASQAVDQASNATDAICLYQPPADEHEVARRLALTADLRQAIEQNQLMLFCQPKIDLRSRRVCSAEALARWQHPQHGMIPPAEFIPLAEQTGLIRPLTYWALATAARHLHDWRQHNVQVPLAVNLSVRNLRDPQLIDRIDACLASWDLGPEWLELEITESAMMEDPAAMRAVLSRLSDKGFKLFIDDFGTGYSSLAYLKTLPVDAIKIDKSFVDDLVTDAGAARIVRTIIDLAHDMGFKVVAEGVENEETLNRLVALGCDEAQGYFIARPFPSGELSAWLATTSWSSG